MNEGRIWTAATGLGVVSLLWVLTVQVAGVIGPGPHHLVGIDPAVLVGVVLREEVSWRGIWLSSAIYPGDGVLAFSAVVATGLLLVAFAMAVIVARGGGERLRRALPLDMLVLNQRSRTMPLVLLIAVAAAVGAIWTVTLGATTAAAFLVVGLFLAISGVAWISGRGPYGLSLRVPRPWTVAARAGWYDRLFLGWSRGIVAQPRFVLGTNEDSLGIVGPPRLSRKTSGIVMLQLCLWGGPAISTSTKPDVFRATARRRLELAREHGGQIHIYAPTAKPGELVEGLPPIRWSPLDGCTDATVAGLRVRVLLEVAATGKAMENPDHWKRGAGRVLRPYFLAAAHHPVRPRDMTVVLDWLARTEIQEPLDILHGLNSLAGDRWAEELVGVAKVPDKERGSFYSSARNALDFLDDPSVLRSCSDTELDVERFLLQRETLFIVSPTEDQEAVAPLISTLIEWIVVKAYQLHREGRLDARLQLNLDELANACPLPSLASILSQGGGQGVNASYVLQSMAQLRDRWGADRAEAIWSASTVKLIFGGLTDIRFLEAISSLIGDKEVKTTSRSKGPDGKLHVTTSTVYRARLPVSDLRGLTTGWVLLLYHQMQPYVLRVPVASKRWRLRRLLEEWDADAVAPALIAAESGQTAGSEEEA